MKDPRAPYSVMVKTDFGDVYPEIEEYATFKDAKAGLERAKKATFTTKSNGRTYFTYNGDDQLSIVDREGVTYEKWSRDTGDMELGHDGWQIINAEGFNIHAEADDPFGLNSFSVLTGEAVDVARQWVDDHPGYFMMPVVKGSIEEPEFVESLPTAPAP